MSRLVLVAVLLAVAAVVRAEDDEQMLETPPAQGIPERMQELEHEWAEDVGTKETDVEPPPEPSPVDEAHDAARGADEAHDAARGAEETPDADLPAPPPHPDEPPVAKKQSTVLESPLHRPTPEHPTVRGTPPAPPKEGAPETPAKRGSRPTTAAED